MGLTRKCSNRSNLVFSFLLLFLNRGLAQEVLGEAELVLAVDGGLPQYRYEMEPFLSTQLGDLKNYLDYQLLVQGECNADFYLSNFSSLKFYFDLMAMSLIRSELEDLSKFELKLVGNKGPCQKKMSMLWNECEQGTYKQFFKDSFHLLSVLERDEKTQELTPKEKNEFIEEKLKTLQSKRQKALFESLKKGEMDSLEDFCREDYEQLKKICTHGSDLYGISRVSWFSEEILSYLDTSLYDQSAKRMCVQRFVYDNKDFEFVHDDLISLFNGQSKEMKSRRFAYGTLMEMNSLLEKEKLGMVKIDSVKKLEEINQIQVLKVTKIDRPKNIMPLVLPTPTALPTVSPGKEIYVSAFDRAYQEFEKKGKQNAVLVDPQQFLQDYPQIKEKTAVFEEFLAPYSTYQRLLEVRTLEKVGTSKAPMLLSIIKFLIDRNRHKNLFDIVGVFGEEFYVENDLASNVYPAKVRLNYNSKGVGWELSIVPEFVGKKNN